MVSWAFGYFTINLLVCQSVLGRATLLENITCVSLVKDVLKGGLCMNKQFRFPCLQDIFALNDQLLGEPTLFANMKSK